MSTLYYMGLVAGPLWTRAIKDVGAQLKPYETYLDTAIKAAERHRPALGWREPSEAERREFDTRLRERIERSNADAQQAQRRRDRRQKQIPRGHWVVLEPPPWNAEEPDSTFEKFLDADEFSDRPDLKPSTTLARVAWDVEGRALLLDKPPTLVAPPREREHLQASLAEPHGQLLWIRVDTYGLDRQRRALHTLDNFPIARFGPLVDLLRTNPRWPRCEAPRLPDEAWIFLRPERSDEALRDGTSEQRRFVEIALATPDFAVLEGPPGSGKTTAICELVVQLARAGLRTLLVASTNVAVDNVLERLIEWQDLLPEEQRVVLPVRIGRPERLSSDKLEPFLYETLARTVCDDVIEFLEQGHDGQSGERARELLHERLLRDEDSRESTIRRLVYENVNLVCGTPIGVLAHPEIRERREVGPVALFDVLIVDEASKTTFTEFLVPAIYASKWIVVGDIKQLSPYVEGEDIAENLRRELASLDIEIEAHAAVRAFEAAPEGKVERSLVACDEHLAEALREEARARNVCFVDLDDCEAQTVAGVADVVPELLAPNLVFGQPDTIAAFEHRLPETLDVFDGPLPALDDYWAVYRHFHRREPELPKDWASEYGWRLVRSYELRQNRVEREHLARQLEGLLPTTIGGQTRAELERRAARIRRVALPSILELIQTGFERLPGWNQGTALNDGLPEHVLRERMVSLSYQHRMHPDISAFSREQFYSDESEAKVLLRDARTIERSWGYTGHARRALWIDVRRPREQRGNCNEAEVDVVMRELGKFIAWAKGEGRPARPWRVAILTFYKPQESLLRTRLRQLTRQVGNSRNFAVPREQPLIEITLCTVDRFQGHEADLVLLSFVRGTGRGRSVGFLNSPNRLNVALTRARYQIVLVGDRSFFAESSSALLQTLARSPHYPATLAFGDDQ